MKGLLSQVAEYRCAVQENGSSRPSIGLLNDALKTDKHVLHFARVILSAGLRSAAMDLRPSAEQQQLVESFVALYAKESSPERVRAAETPGGTGAAGHDPALWDHLLELGVVAMAVPEHHDGWGGVRSSIWP